MAETVYIPSEVTGKKEKYEMLLPQIYALVEGEHDLIANLSNIMAALKYGMNFFWVGIYFVKTPFETKQHHEKELVLGPFQGPVACVRIAFGKGVCGTCWEKEETIIVEDVEKFPGHIACNADSKSEIVIPVFRNGTVKAVLDVDSNKPADFDDIDAVYLKKISNLVENLLWKQ
jgi:L-methionine (R)-S-oxide reductase